MRRGTEKAEIYSICFDMKSQRLACSSDHGTIHVFQVQLDTSGGIKLSNDEKDGADGKADPLLAASAADYSKA